MFTIKRQGGKVPVVLKNTFQSYQEARNAIKRWVRLSAKRGRTQITHVEKALRTINIGMHGFSISKV